MTELIDQIFSPLVAFLATIIFWDPIAALGFDIGTKVPIVVVWLVIGAVFFTIRMGFVNIRCFRLAIQLVSGKYEEPGEKGQVSHFQALTTALSATVGLGNIAGVAVAITVGGPGATFWMIVAGLLGMTSKFTECTLGLKYRKVNADGEVSGGPMYYIPVAFERLGIPKAGKWAGVLFAILCVGGSLGGGNMFQANQAFAQVSSQVPFAQGNSLWFGAILAILTAAVIIGGIKNIANVTEKIVPIMAVLYVATSLYIIIANYNLIGQTFSLILDGAFNGSALKGGIIGVIITGFQRASFSNEAGVGSASIAHAAARTGKPISEGIVALLEPFIDTVLICTMTAFVIIITGFYNVTSMEGTQLTSAAYGSVVSWFPMLLVVAVFLFAFSTMISWSYYGLKAWQYMFGDGKTTELIYKLIFLVCIVIGSSANLDPVIDFSDMMILAMAFPNIFALYVLSGEVRRDLDIYLKDFQTTYLKRKE